MFNFSKKTDEYLVKNRPAIWLTKYHKGFPTAILLLFTLIGLQSFLPIYFNLTTLFIATATVAVLFMIVIIRVQYLYFNINITPVQLHRIFWINVIYFSLAALIAVIPPCMFSLKVNKAIKERYFTSDEEQIRISMISKEDMIILKTGLATNTVYLDSLYDHNPNEFERLRRRIADIKKNKFINQSLNQADFTTVTTDSAIVVSAEDTTAIMIDTGAVKIDTVKKQPWDFSPEPARNTGAGLLNIVKDDYNWQTPFLVSLRAMSYAEIDSIKNNIDPIFNVYGLRRYNDYYDSSSSSLNPYFEVLNKQFLTIYSNARFISNYGYDDSFWDLLNWDVLNYVVLLVLISLLIFIFSFIKMRIWEKLASLLLVTGILVIISYEIVYLRNMIRQSMIESMNSGYIKEYMNDYYYAGIILSSLNLVILGLIVFFWKMRSGYSSFKAVLLLSVYIALGFCSLFFIVNLSNIITDYLKLDDNPSFLIFLPFLVVIFFINKVFMKKFFLINNTPK